MSTNKETKNKNNTSNSNKGTSNINSNINSNSNSNKSNSTEKRNHHLPQYGDSRVKYGSSNQYGISDSDYYDDSALYF